LGHLRNPATLSANATESVSQIISDDRRFDLREPIDLTCRTKGPYHFIAYEPLGIEGYGRDEQAALESFADLFSTTWAWIAEAKDRDLGGEARELKRKLLDLVASVNSARRRRFTSTG